MAVTFWVAECTGVLTCCPASNISEPADRLAEALELNAEMEVSVKLSVDDMDMQLPKREGSHLHGSDTESKLFSVDPGRGGH